MAVTLRLSRTGRKNNPSFRIVAVEKKKKRDGASIEILGFYNPLSDPFTLNLDMKKLQVWVDRGAVISEGLLKLLKKRKAVKMG